MAYLKPQTPLKDKNTGDYFYPLTTVDQVVMPDGSRLNSVFKHTVQKEVTLLASGWSSNAPYTQTITMDDYIDNLKVDANIVYSGIKETDLGLNKAASCLSYIKKNGKNVTFYCLSGKPEIDVPVEISYGTINNIADVTVIDGIKLNFKVLGGINQPTNPEENTIWVQTEDEENVVIEKWSFGAEEPEAPADNMVWIVTSTSSSVKFDAIKDNDIQLYPISAKQYVGGAWVDKTAKSWQGGKWAEWISYLYNAGDECESITGGWDAFSIPYTSGTGSGSLSVTRNADHIILSNNGEGSTFRTKEAVDLSAYTTLVLDCETNFAGTYGYFRLCVWSSIGSTWASNVVAEHMFESGKLTKEVKIDVSQLSGMFYVGFGFFYGATIKMEEMRRE